MAPHYLAQQIERLDIRILEELRAIVMRINLREYAMTEDEAMALAERLRAAAWQLGAEKHGRGEP